MKKIMAIMLSAVLLLTSCSGEAEKPAVLSSESSSFGESKTEISTEDISKQEEKSDKSEEPKSDSWCLVVYSKPEKTVEFEEKEDSEFDAAKDNMKSYIKRANSSSSYGEVLLWKNAVNEQQKGECPVLVFNSKTELQKFVTDLGKYFQIGEGEGSLKELLLEYDEEFFKENTLIIGHILSNSGSVRHSVKGISVSQNTCTVNIKSEMPQVGTMDMADWFVVAEVPTAKIKNCENFALSAKSASSSSDVEWSNK